MKKWIHASTDFDLNKLVDAEEYGDLTVREAIDETTYSMYDNYKYDENADYDLILEVIVEHLDDPDTYNLKVGEDYSKKDVAEEMEKYDWELAKEEDRPEGNRTVNRWRHEVGLS